MASKEQIAHLSLPILDEHGIPYKPSVALLKVLVTGREVGEIAEVIFAHPHQMMDSAAKSFEQNITSLYAESVGLVI